MATYTEAVVAGIERRGWGMASHWYVGHCKSQKEDQAATALEERLGLLVYLPVVQRRRHGQIRRVPFFPGYLFVRADLQLIAPSQVNTLPGIVRLVAFGDAPQPVPAPVVEEVRRRVEQLDTQGSLTMHNFRPGDTVRLTSGPFDGLEAMFLGPMRPSERVRVLIEFLGALRNMDVAGNQLELVGAAPAIRPPRRTRGRGRLIR